jgi:hypothetical protein
LRDLTFKTFISSSTTPSRSAARRAQRDLDYITQQKRQHASLKAATGGVFVNTQTTPSHRER